MYLPSALNTGKQINVVLSDNTLKLIHKHEKRIFQT